MTKKRGRHIADDALALSLACGATIESAATKAGVSFSTVNRRLSDPVFRGQIQTIRNDLVHRVTALLTAAALEAAKTLPWRSSKVLAASRAAAVSKAVTRWTMSLRMA